MSLHIVEECRKRRRRPKIFGFQSFGNPGCPIDPKGGPFRDNIRVFLQECAVLEDYTIMGMPIWCSLLLHEKKSFVIPFYTFLEDVDSSLSPSPSCDQCRCAGWSHHFVSRRRYHMIIPIDSAWHKPLDPDALEVSSHLLHGLIHCNGFGHLLCINGIEGGSSLLCGREIMDLWDRICTILQVRKISVEDVSRKRCMDLRLLYGVAYGHPWFGRWGYRFLRGSFGVKEHKYNQAIAFLSSLELDQILKDFKDTKQYKYIREIICHYKDMSETNLITIRDLLRFMLTIKHNNKFNAAALGCNNNPSSDSNPGKSHREAMRNKLGPLKAAKPVRYRKFSTAIADTDSRWPVRRLEQAALVIVNALLENKADRVGLGHVHVGMPRQDVRDAARLHIGDTGLLDNVLKIMNNVIVHNYVVRRQVNPSTRILEYTIHEVGKEETPRETQDQSAKDGIEEDILSLVPGANVYSDVLYIYTNVLLDYPKSDWVDVAAQAILDSKHFVKEWPLRDEAEQLLTFICTLMPTMVELLGRRGAEVSPGEIVVVPLHATIGELKRAAEKALRDTYCILEEFEVTDIQGLEEIEDDELLFGVIESGAQVWVRGRGVYLDTPLIYEGGSENWKVRCECGAQDDDGERMVACDICEVWHHTRCCGIEDSDNAPPLFVCSGCCESVSSSRLEDDLAFEYDHPDSFEQYSTLLLPPLPPLEYGI